MVNNKAIAQKAAHDIREYLLCNHGRSPAVLEQRVARTVEAAINEAGAEKQQIDKLVGALGHAVWRILNHGLSWDEHPDGYTCHYCPCGGFPSPGQIKHEVWCVLGAVHTTLRAIPGDWNRFERKLL